MKRHAWPQAAGERVCPPVPGWDEQQHRNENCVRGKEQRNLAIGNTNFPGELRGQIVTNSGGQNPESDEAERPGSFLPLHS